jgi:hypothetical protein
LCREALQRLAAAKAALHEPAAAVDAVWAFLHGCVSLAMSRRIAGSPGRTRRLMLRALPCLLASTLG